MHAEGRTGWYGPVADEPARCVSAVIANTADGKRVTDHRALNAALRCAVGPRPSVAASWAVGAVDCAAWDLHGQLAGVPVANLIAASPAKTVPLYASWLRLDLTQPSAADAVARVGGDSWLFTKWGLRRVLTAKPQTEATHLASTAQQAVATLGEKAAFDTVFTWDIDLTKAFAEIVDPAAVLWLEDPLAGSDRTAYREIDRLKIPLAVGERLNICDDASAELSPMLRAFTLDVVSCGGLTRAIDLVAQASAAGIPVFPHGRSLVPAVHLAAAFPQSVAAAEYQLQWEPIRQLLYTEPWLPIRGRITLPTTPGLGITPRRQ